MVSLSYGIRYSVWYPVPLTLAYYEINDTNQGTKFDEKFN